MARPPATVERLLDAARRGRWDDVGAGGEPLAASLLAHPELARWAPAAVLMAGWARAQQGHLPTAIDLVERSLHHLHDPEVRRAVGGTDAVHVLLVELYLLVGEQAAALEQIEALRTPDAPLRVRFPAYRALAAIAADRGDDAHAEGFCATAADLARQVGTRDAELLVVGDRLRWLAAAGRAAEAAAGAEQIGPLLARRRGAETTRRAAGAAVLLAVGHALAEAGDPSAGTWADRADTLTAGLAPGAARRLAAHGDLVRAVARRQAGDLVTAADAARRARRELARIGARPAVALATVEEARIAAAQGLAASAESMLLDAARELTECGHLRRAGHAALLAKGLPTLVGASHGASVPLGG